MIASPSAMCARDTAVSDAEQLPPASSPNGLPLSLRFASRRRLTQSWPLCLVIKILRADQGSNYTSSTVRHFLAARGIKLLLAAVHTPHQIRVVETARSVINSTMRAIMYFANAPREIWALGCRYSALLNNMMATRYNQGSND